jgi:membrane protease YdiL (CAAX protease family)
LEPQNSGRLSFFNGNTLYMTVMILFVTVGYIAQQRDFTSGILITEFLLIALPAIIFTKSNGASVKKELRFNSLSFIDALLVIVAAVSAYFVAVFINLVAEIFISMMGDLIVPDIPFAKNLKEYLLLLFLIAGSAGICEEILFRGFILRSYEKLGMWPGIIITALLFSMLHLNIQNMAAPFFLGIFLGFVVYKTNSIYAGMLGHFINNGVSVTWGYVIMSLPFYRSISAEQLQGGVTTQSLVGASVFFGLLLPFAGTIMVLCLKAISDRHPEAAFRKSDESFMCLLKNIRLSWPLLICLLIFIGMMIIEIMLITNGKRLINF